eukprot:scaffold10898_cov59-Phaeocystis_antarctica.AAC.2
MHASKRIMCMPGTRDLLDGKFLASLANTLHSLSATIQTPRTKRPHTRGSTHASSPVHAACLPKADLQSVRQGVLSIDMEHVCVHWGFNVGLALV